MNYLNSITIFLILVSFQVKSQLYLNEVSQGTGNPPDEYIELVVVGQTTCTDTCLDIRGWIIDDNNGFFGTTGIAGGHIRFTNDPQWACVPYGSIITIYSNYNTTAGLVEDSTDANNDNIYVLNPTSSLIEADGNLPMASTPTNSYAGGTYSSNGQWLMLAQRNDGDAVLLVSPTNLNAPFHSVGWGDISGTSIYFTGSASNLTYAFLNDFSDDINDQSNWSALGIANATPGVANNAANQAWINQMKTIQSFPESYDTILGCTGDSVFYVPNNAWYRSTNTFTEVIPVGKCDSTAYHTIYFKPITTAKDTLAECISDSIQFKGIWYNQDTIIKDTLTNTNGCDSIVERYLMLGQNKSSLDTLYGCQGDSVFVNGLWVKQDSLVTQNYQTSKGCDSIVQTQALFYPSVLVQDSILNCQGDTIVIDGKSIFQDTTIIETYAYGNCDSTVITRCFFLPQKVSYDTTSFCFGDSIELNNVWYKNDTTLVEVFPTLTCDSTAYLTLIKLGQVFPVVDSLFICPGEIITIDGVQCQSDTSFTVAYPTNLCDSLVDYVVEVIDVPELEIYGDSILCLESNESLVLMASDGFDDYLWSNNDNSIFTTVNTSGDYYVDAIFRGCTVSDTTYLEKIWCDSSCLKYVPNAISPNNDGINDMFKVDFAEEFCDFSSAEYRIFNRWGKLIFTSENITDEWNAEYKGRIVSPGVYIYKINYLIKGEVEQHQLFGHLSIVK